MAYQRLCPSPPRILVVEDEVLVALTISDMLEEFGCEVVGPVGGVAAACALLNSGAALPGAAVLDCNLGREMVWPVADALAARAVPFLFSTAYGIAGVEPRFAKAPVVTKPFDILDLKSALALLIELR